MASTQLYSVKEGKLVDFDLTVDDKGEIIATHDDQTLKFPAGMTKKQLQAAFEAHNKANDGLKALTEEELQEKDQAIADSKKLLEEL